MMSAAAMAIKSAAISSIARLDLSLSNLRLPGRISGIDVEDAGS